MSEPGSRPRALWRGAAVAGFLILAGSLIGLRFALVHGDSVLTKPLTLEGGIRVERVEGPRSARLVVARIPRGKKLRLRAALLSEKRELVRLAPAAKAMGALVAINGDYHFLKGPCLAGTYSTLVDGGRIDVLGSPFSYAAAFWQDDAGQPRIGKLDLSCSAKLPSGKTANLFVNMPQGDLIWIDRCPKGTWKLPGYIGLPAKGSLATGRLEIGGPAKSRLRGPSLLARIGSPPEQEARGLTKGQVVELTVTLPKGGVQLAIGTGPRLLEGGQIHADARLDSPGWVGRYGRTAVAMNGEELFLVTTVRKAQDALTMVDFAQALKDLGCQEALNLDGGPSTTLWADQATQNLPRGRRADAVASGLFVLPPGEGVSLR